MFLVLTFIVRRGRLRAADQYRPAAQPDRDLCPQHLAEAILLAGLGAADLCLPAVRTGPLLAIGLSFLMGLQNAVVTRISGARIRNAHVTGMVTDIGIELGNIADIALQRGSPAQAAANRKKLALHVQTVLSFLGGGIVGAFAYERFGALALFGAAGLLAALALPAIASRHARLPGTMPG
ncbi:MAG: YoaK family protein [Acetobacteraceae bacterium]